jgi:hypothetical protein
MDAAYEARLLDFEIDLQKRFSLNQQSHLYQ